MKTEYWVDDPSITGVSQHLHIVTKKKIVDRISYILPYVKDKKVLSVGCGSGFSENEYNRLAKQVVGIDINEKAIEYAQKHYYGVSFICYDSAQITPNLFGLEEFDVVVSTEVLEHLPKEKLDKTIEGIKNVLRKEGVFVGTVPVEDDVKTNKYHQSHYTREDLVYLLKKHGFKNIFVEKIEYPHSQYFFGDNWLFHGVKK